MSSRTTGEILDAVVSGARHEESELALRLAKEGDATLLLPLLRGEHGSEGFASGLRVIGEGMLRAYEPFLRERLERASGDELCDVAETLSCLRPGDPTSVRRLAREWWKLQGVPGAAASEARGGIVLTLIDLADGDPDAAMGVFGEAALGEDEWNDREDRGHAAPEWEAWDELALRLAPGIPCASRHHAPAALAALRHRDASARRLAAAPTRRFGPAIRLGALMVSAARPVRAAGRAEASEDPAAVARRVAASRCDALFVRVRGAADTGGLRAIRAACGVPVVADAIGDARVAHAVARDADGVALRVASEQPLDELRHLFARCRGLGLPAVLQLPVDERGAWRALADRVERSALEADFRHFAWSLHPPGDPIAFVEAHRALARQTLHRIVVRVHESTAGEVARARAAAVVACLLADGLADLVEVSGGEDANADAELATWLVRHAVTSQASGVEVERRVAQGAASRSAAVVRRWNGRAPAPFRTHVELPAWRRRPTERVAVGEAAIGGDAPVAPWFVTSYFGVGVASLMDRAAHGSAVPAGAYVSCLGTDTENSMLIGCGVEPVGRPGHVPAMIACDPLTLDEDGVDPDVAAVGDLLLCMPSLEFRRGRDAAAMAQRILEAGRVPGVVVSAWEIPEGGALAERVATAAVSAAHAVLEATGVLPLLAFCLPQGVSPVHPLRMACMVERIVWAPFLITRPISARDACRGSGGWGRGANTSRPAAPATGPAKERGAG